MSEGVGVVFPAFGSEYLGNEKELLGRYSDNLDDYFEKTKQVFPIDFNEFETKVKGNFSDELQSQIICYLYSCIFGDIIKKNNIPVHRISAYSMGLYAALNFAGSIDFLDGMRVIKFCYDLVLGNSSQYRFSMGIVVGLNEEDLRRVIRNGNFIDIEIINKNSENSMLLSGMETDIIRLMELCLHEGALYAKPVSMKSPFHTKFVGDVEGKIISYIDDSIAIQDPKYTLVSCYDQRAVTTADDVKKEIILNVRHTQNWMNTFTAMVDQGSKNIIECGPGDSLTKIAKFISGDFKMYNLKKMESILQFSAVNC
jgi:[acyl-carrier-protein] S-malonyltransferase